MQIHSYLGVDGRFRIGQTVLPVSDGRRAGTPRLDGETRFGMVADRFGVVRKIIASA